MGCFDGFQPEPTTKVNTAELDKVKNELATCRGDLNSANDQLQHLNTQFTAANQSLDRYRTYTEQQTQSINQLNNQVTLYRQELEKDRAAYNKLVAELD